ncbi:hypothetical protein AKJ38_02025 [candidate division MSBL1 archaeon SCGC-AAA259I14]|uniref:MoaD family protein n=2 Tax=candidate division MSBL1 TaxID=215777 RepID=A0A133USA3_9EURY|nr:hypothetical protein AKJ61_02545 [candidate division MSBL1 archaeon SCGC-AAA259B11]KXA97073.1 hypothetical protein AKJ38_02025 [candidate division MSBL1 archaeon SCGC-AAA259I14]
MTVEVKFFANFREIAGEKKINVSADNIRELLKGIVEDYGGLEEQIFANPETEELTDFVTILVNGRSIDTLNGLDTELNENDTVAIFPPVSGG